MSDYTIIPAKNEPPQFLCGLSGRQTGHSDNIFRHKTEYVLLCDSDAGLTRAGTAGLPLVAVRHEGNAGDSLMQAPWLIDSPESLTPAFLTEIICRHYGLPLTILETDRYLVRELTLDDLDMLWTLQEENVKNPSGSFFPEGLSRDAAEEYLNNYIQYRYPFYGYGIYAIILKDDHENQGNQTAAGIAGFSEYKANSRPDLPAEVPSGEVHTVSGELLSPLMTDTEKGDSPSDVEVGYSLLRPCRGRGIMSEVLPALLEYGRKQHGFRSILVRTDRENLPSIRLAQKNKLAIINTVRTQDTYNAKKPDEHWLFHLS